MKKIVIILLLSVSCVLYSQEYLMPFNDTMDIIILHQNIVADFTIDIGRFSRIEPVSLDGEYYYLPHRCLVDNDMINSFNFLNKERKGHLIISKKTFDNKNNYTYLRDDFPINNQTHLE